MAVYRVHWLKAKSRRDRWREEELLLTSEMEWTELFFRHRASRWKNLAAKSSAIALRTSHSNESEHPQGSRIFPKAETQRSQGHICYALKLESMWNRLAQQTILRFSVAKAKQQHRTRSSSF